MVTNNIVKYVKKAVRIASVDTVSMQAEEKTGGSISSAGPATGTGTWPGPSAIFSDQVDTKCYFLMWACPRGMVANGV